MPFFIVFMNDMPMSTRTISNVDMYADDSTISACVVHTDLKHLDQNNPVK